MHHNTPAPPALEALGRLLLASLFVIAGLQKIAGYAGVAGWMDSIGVSGALLPFVIALEVLGGIAIVVGFKTRFVALALAAFSVLAALIFHNNLGDETQFLMFMKNLVIAGGFLVLATHGAGAWSLDARTMPGAREARA